MTLRESLVELNCPLCGEADCVCDLDVCPGCGAPVGEPCAVDCEYADTLDSDMEDVMAIQMGESDEDRPNELVDPGARNHPNDCECRSCAALSESVNFDKFVDRILKEERGGQGLRVTDNCNRLRAARVQERPMGRTRMGVR